MCLCYSALLADRGDHGIMVAVVVHIYFELDIQFIFHSASIF